MIFSLYDFLNICEIDILIYLWAIWAGPARHFGWAIWAGPAQKIGPWAGPGPSAKHEACGSPARWHDGPNLARHDRAGPGPGGPFAHLYMRSLHHGTMLFFLLVAS